MKKATDFSEWYNDVVERAGLTDKRYPVKGMNVWTPYGWKIMRLIDEEVRRQFDATGHGEVNFPLLIPEQEFAKEREHIKGFDEEVFWVTHAGKNPLDVRLLLRPTSETAMYPIFALWVRSHADLPLKTYQIVNIFRYETKQTRAFIRVREIHFFEAHTCHADFEDAERQVAEDCAIMRRLGEQWGLPFLFLRRSEWDKFPGADYTLGIDSLLPTGRSIQLGSIHQYRENFSRPYEIKYEDDKGELHYVHQTTYGMSERLVGAIAAIHGDDRGLILPPAVAPIQVVLIPVLAKGKTTEVTAAVRALKGRLDKAGLRAHLDERDLRPGAKYYEWELKGVPLRLELGTRDLKEGVVTFVRRDTGERFTVPDREVEHRVRAVLEEIRKSLAARANEEMERGVVTLGSLPAKLPEKILRVGWCGEASCGHALEERSQMSLLGTPHESEPFEGRCIVCEKPTKTPLYLARAL